MINEIKTFVDIVNAIIYRAKTGSDASTVAIIKEKINTAYQQIAFEEPYRWSGDTNMLMLRGTYSTGTIAIVNGSDIIAGTGTVWTRIGHEERKIKIGSARFPYKILRVDEGAQTITINASITDTTASGVGYTIFKDEYGLFPDLQDIRKLRIPGLAESLQPMPIGPNEIDILRDRMPFAGGVPKRYTIFGNAHYAAKTWLNFNLGTDFWEDDLDDPLRNKTMVVWPGVLTLDRPAYVRYTKTVEPMTYDLQEPLIPYENRSVLVYRVLIDHFATNRDAITRGMWKAEFEDQKQKMEGDIESVDDELILQLDKSQFGWTGSFQNLDEDIYSIE